MRHSYDLAAAAMAAQAPQRGTFLDRAEALAGNADIDYNPVPNRRHCIRGIVFGYDSDPSQTGFVEVYCGTTCVFRCPVTTGGAGPMEWVTRRGAPNEAMKIRLTSGGQGVTGYINTENYWQET